MRHSKRYKSTVSTGTDGLYGFHPEDEVVVQVGVPLHDATLADPVQYATHTTTYAFKDVPRDELDVRGRAMLVPAGAFKRLVSTMSETYPV